MKRLVCGSLMVLALTALVGCGLPKDVRKNAEEVPKQLDAAAAEVSDRASKFEALKGTDEYKQFLAPYAEREKWADSFTQAQAKLQAARDVDKKQLGPLLEEDNPKKVADVELAIRQVDALRKEALDLSKQPNAKVGWLREVKTKAPSMVATAQQQAGESRQVITGLQSVVSTQQAKYPNRSADITARFTPTQALLTELETALKTAETQFSGVANGSCDYAVLGDSILVVTANYGKIGASDKPVRGVLGQLDRSYSKTLVDMKVDYYIVVGRTSWDEASDLNTEHDYSYPAVMVTPKAYEYFGALGDATLAEQGMGFLSSTSDVKSKVEPDYWNMLKINPQAGWPSGHDQAEYWISDDPVKYYHKYLVIENNQEKQTDWVEVTEELFEAHEDDLGMDIVAKPVGMFEDETLKLAMPAGMAFVGNPEYGEWKKDESTGDSFWAFYGRYHFYSSLLDPTYGRGYYRSEWNTWDRDYRRAGKSYYGPDPDSERYGTASAGSQKKYATAHAFGNSGVAKGSRPTGSVRGAGSSTRGGGPGKGGK